MGLVGGGAVLLAAACAGGAGQPGGSASGGAKARTPVTLQIWENARHKWREGVGKELTDPLLAANPWLTLETSIPAGNAREKVLAAAAGGTPPDSYTTGSYITQQDFVDGVATSLEKYLSSSKVAKKADIWQSLRRDVEFKGHMTGMPYAPDTRLLYTNHEAARRAGLDPDKPPTTWSEMLSAVRRSYRADAGATLHQAWNPFAGTSGNYTWLVPYWQLGAETLNPDQTKVTFFNEKAIDALTWLKQIVDAQGGWQAMDAFRTQYKAPVGAEMFMQGGATFLYENLWSRSQQFAVQAPTVRFTLSTFPLPDKGGSVANYGGCPCLCLTKGSKGADATWLFIEHVTSPESNVKFALANDLVPIRESSTTSAAYVGTDKARALQAQEMKRRRFVIAAPGGADMLALQDVVTPFLSGKLSLQDSLKEQERLAQEVLDRYLVRSRGSTPS